MELARSAQKLLGGELSSLDFGQLGALEELLDAMYDLVFFVKDHEGRYRFVNETLVRRVGGTSKEYLIGRRVDEIFQEPFGEAFRSQDEQVLRAGRAIRDRLELHLYPRRATGWCRTFKLPLFDGGRTAGLMGISKDLHRPASDQTPAAVSRALAHLETKLHRRISVGELATVAGMATRTFERAVQNLFRVSAGDLVIQARIDAACRLLRDTELSISHISQRAGYGDHSSFTRQFRSRVGLTPRAFRAMSSDIARDRR